MKRLLSLLVAIVMVISVVPATFATGDVGGTPDVGLWDVEDIANINVTANLAAGDDNGNYYLWTADEDGKMIVTSSAAAGYAYNIVMTKGETVVSGTSLELDVVKGDEVLIQVVATGEGFPAGTVTVTGAYYVEPPVEPETGIVINAQPQDFGFVVNKDATFTVDASNVVKYVWYWRKSADAEFAVASAFSGYKTATITVPVKGDYFAGYEFKCRLDDADGNQIYTDVVTLFPKVANVTIGGYGTNNPIVEGKSAAYVLLNVQGAVRYQWMASTDKGATWTTIGANDTNGATSDRFYVKAWQSNAGNLYRCKIWDADGAFIYSDTFEMKVAENPLVGEPISDITWAIKGQKVTFTFNVTGAEVAKYQWFTSRDGKSWGKTTLTGFNQASFTFDAYGSRDGLYLRCMATAADGNKIYSNASQLKLEANPFEIVAQPTNITAAKNSKAVFTVAVAGFEGEEVSLTYRWQYQKPGESTWANWGAADGKTNTVTVDAYAARNGWRFRCYIKDSVGHYTYTDKVTLTVE